MASWCFERAGWLLACGVLLGPAGCADDGALNTTDPSESSTGTAGTSTGVVTTVSPGTVGATSSVDSTTTTTPGDTTVASGTTSGPMPGTSGSTGGTTEPGTSTGGTSSGGASSSSSDGGPGCGNGVIEPGEQCDGADLQGFDCASLGLGGGVLGCDPATCTFDTSMCMPMGFCGNGAIDPGEQCDGADLQGFDCASLGLGGGVLACDPVMCTFDTSMCMPGGGTSG